MKKVSVYRRSAPASKIALITIECQREAFIEREFCSTDLRRIRTLFLFTKSSPKVEYCSPVFYAAACRARMHYWHVVAPHSCFERETHDVHQWVNKQWVIKQLTKPFNFVTIAICFGQSSPFLHSTSTRLHLIDVQLQLEEVGSMRSRFEDSSTYICAQGTRSIWKDTSTFHRFWKACLHSCSG
jgi:hypothetical protein